jgi:molecular chaperone DnaK
MVREAEKHAAEDQQRRDLIEARNAADQVAYQAEKSLGSLNGQTPASLKQDLEAKISELKEAAQGENVERIRQLTQEVQQASMSIGQAAYQGETPGEAPNNGANSTNGSVRDDEDIVEGEFEEA